MGAITFSANTTEDKNDHIEHLEDLILNHGVDGTRNAINFIRSIRDKIAGRSNGVALSVKWDGSPSIVAGIDPTDGKFFVAKKSVFNREPKVYKSELDIDLDTTGDLNKKMKLALSELSKLDIKGIIQGDFLYAREDLKEVEIDGAYANQ
jgi:hypothetical protein